MSCVGANPSMELLKLSKSKRGDLVCAARDVVAVDMTKHSRGSICIFCEIYHQVSIWSAVVHVVVADSSKRSGRMQISSLYPGDSTHILMMLKKEIGTVQ